jgi:hypothetical protein
MDTWRYRPNPMVTAMTTATIAVMITEDVLLSPACSCGFLNGLRHDDEPKIA